MDYAELIKVVPKWIFGIAAVGAIVVIVHAMFFLECRKVLFGLAFGPENPCGASTDQVHQNERTYLLGELKKELQKIQSGYKTCPKSWSSTASTTNTLARTLDVSFDQDFSKPPLVFLSVLLSEYKNHTEYYYRPSDVSGRGFKVEVWVADNTQIGDCVVQWLAIPSSSHRTAPTANKVLD